MLGKKKEYKSFTVEDELPKLSVLLSVYNEESVIAAKIESVFNTKYPREKIEFLIGSDNSDDKTNEIITRCVQTNQSVRFFPFARRQGKQNVINKLVDEAVGEILVLTDANVFFNENTLFEMVKYFKDTRVGLVDTQMLHSGLIANGISVQESAYINREAKIKNQESLLWGSMMGPFGGCYAVRKDAYSRVPSTFLVDDFYINTQVLLKGLYAINNLKALVYEDVSNNLKDEFRRKIRIATGNFQNLKKFGFVLFKSLYSKSISVGMGFTFFSHKVIRWFVPLLVISMAITSAFMSSEILYFALLLALMSSFLIPFVDLILKNWGINLKLLRFTTHFYSMNLALLIGLFKFFKGVKTGTWKPTKRNQSLDD